MTPTNILAHIIHLRSDTLILSKVQYPDWEAIQNDFEDYMTSLGPWNVGEIISHFESEYRDESSWIFSREQIDSFMKSGEHFLTVKELNLLDLKGKSATALQFNEYINARDITGLTSLMTEDYTFIDSANDVHEGKEMMTEGWQDFFDTYPDYRNIFQDVYMRNGEVIMLGYSVCSHLPLDGPAIWSAKIRDGLLNEWRVYHDTPENRSILGID